MKKLGNVLLIAGICIILVGIVVGIVLGFSTDDKGFNLVYAIPVWLLSGIAGGGCASVSGSLGEAQQDKDDDLELLNSIIEKVKNENKE